MLAALPVSVSTEVGSSQQQLTSCPQILRSPPIPKLCDIRKPLELRSAVTDKLPLATSLDSGVLTSRVHEQGDQETVAQSQSDEAMWKNNQWSLVTLVAIEDKERRLPIWRQSASKYIDLTGKLRIARLCSEPPGLVARKSRSYPNQ